MFEINLLACYNADLKGDKNMNIDANLKKELKSQGYLPSRDGEHVAVRVITGNGVLSTEQLQVVSDVAKTYGRNEVTFTTRLTVEIPWIKYEDVDAVKEIFAKNNIATGGTGKKVRPLVSCKGTYCVFGLLDTQAFTKRLHELFYEGYREADFPHKIIDDGKTVYYFSQNKKQ